MNTMGYDNQGDAEKKKTLAVYDILTTWRKMSPLLYATRAANSDRSCSWRLFSQCDIMLESPEGPV